MLRRLVLPAAGALALVCGTVPVQAQSYHTHAQIGQELLDAQNNYPALCQRFNLGNSYQGRALWAVCISDNVGVEEDEPEFRYISSMHGDEIMGVEMCLNLVDELLTNYGTDPQITNLVDEVEIWILPLMNPDGYSSSPRTRYNAQGYDLNRSFPEGSGSNPDPNTTTGRPTEVQVVMNWGLGRSFTLAANFHGGALVTNYPFDNDDKGSVYSPTPDDDMFIYISEEYSQHNLPMWNSASFYHGITNGADWYVIDGGMQDWTYRYMGGNEVTIEIGTTKQPPASQIPTYWGDNRDSMLAYLDTCLIGVRGLVTDAETGLPVAATMTVAGRDHEVYTDPAVGDYHRMLLPGTYDLTFAADGYVSHVENDVVVLAGDATRVDVQLSQAAGPPVITTASLPDGYLNTPYGPEQLTASDGQLPLVWSQPPSGAYTETDLGSSGFAAVGTAKGWQGDDSIWAYTLPFTFPFYGTNRTSLTVCANGFVYFGTFSGANYNNSTSGLIANQMIAPLWDDLRTNNPGGNIYIDESVSGQVTIRWSGVTFTGSYPVNLSVTLTDAGVIRFHYGSGNTGLTPTIGISAGNGSDYLVASYSGAASLTNANSLEIAESGGLPAGMTFGPTGELGGTPTEAGTFQPTFIVTDDLGRSDQKMIPLTILYGVPATGDYEPDDDVDLADYRAFQVCYTQPVTGPCAAAFEFVVDGVFDLDDAAGFVNELTGP